MDNCGVVAARIYNVRDCVQFVSAAVVIPVDTLTVQASSTFLSSMLYQTSGLIF